MSVVPRVQGSTRWSIAAAAVTPLTDDEQAWAARVGRRLRAEFNTLLGTLPSHERTGAGLERVLGMNRAVAYRLLAALGASDDLETLMRLPGVEGLRTCTVAARRIAGADAEAIVSAADSAIDDFQELIRAVGGSHARLCARIRAPLAGAAPAGKSMPPGRREDVRRALHESIKTLSGRSVAARMSVSIIRPSAENPRECEYVHARAYIGFRAVSGGLPLVLASWVTVPDNNTGRMPGLDYCDLSGMPLEGRETTGLLEEFCSSPLPIVASRDTTGRLVQVLDHLRAAPGTSMDAVIAYRLPNVGPIPSLNDPPVFLESTNLTVPAEHLVADLYVHRDLAQGAMPSLSVFLGRGTGGCDIIDRWHEQVDGAPVLGLLGTGLGNSYSGAWDRHGELTRRLFDELGWDPVEFVGYRNEERWPLWNCDYIMALDYRSATT